VFDLDLGLFLDLAFFGFWILVLTWLCFVRRNWSSHKLVHNTLFLEYFVTCIICQDYFFGGLERCQAIICSLKNLESGKTVRYLREI
jgi:hypothetical protein